MKRIHALDIQLANQIAAGEVVERPASVVKELIENSVDAGASRIEVDIERGGVRLIRIVDDGHGIHKDDLALALSRHATSKIRNFEELCAVASLGFRGEALASIASVSRLLLRSRIRDSALGWQASAEGREMAVNLAPAAAVQGTCVEVRDLFFNTPARRKFLRTEKTEMTHIEDVVRREALASPHVAMVVKHNGKISKRFPAASLENMAEKLKAACGKPFVDNAVEFHSELESLRIFGWLGAPSQHRSESDNQFIFVNGRPVKDRLLAHAIRQSYADYLPLGRFASYVIYIECPAHEVDVNVHPTKHEVRFRSPRQVHDFLVKLIFESLTRCNELNSFSSSSDSNSSIASDQLNSAPSSFSESVNYKSNQWYPANRVTVGQVAESLNSYHQLSHFAGAIDPSETLICKEETDNEQIDATRTLWRNRYAIVPQESLWLVDCWAWLLDEIASHWQSDALTRTKPLMIPEALSVACPQNLEDAERLDWFNQLGIEMSPSGPQQVMLRKLPRIEPVIPGEIWMEILQLWMSEPQDPHDPVELQQQLFGLLKNVRLKSSDWLANWAFGYLSSNSNWQRHACRFSEHDLLRQIARDSTPNPQTTKIA